MLGMRVLEGTYEKEILPLERLANCDVFQLHNWVNLI